MAQPLLADNDLVALRRAAALTHTVGGVSIDLRSGPTTVATVIGSAHGSHPAGTARTATHRSIDACGFRQAVAAAWSDHRAGRAVGVIGADSADFELDWSVAGGGALLGFGALRTHYGGRIVWAVASVLDVDTLAGVIAEVDDGLDDQHTLVDNPPTLVARVVHDELLDVAVVHIEIDTTTPALIRAIDELLVRLVAAIASTELLNDLARAA